MVLIMGNVSIMKDGNEVENKVEWFWLNAVYQQSKVMFLFLFGDNGNQKVKKNLSLSFWSLLVTFLPKTSSLWSVGVVCTAGSGSLGLSDTVSPLLLWCFWHICFYTFRVQPEQYPDSRFAFCCQWNTTGSTSGFLKGLGTASALVNNFYYLTSDLSVWSGGWP